MIQLCHFLQFIQEHSAPPEEEIHVHAVLSVTWDKGAGHGTRFEEF